MSMRKIVIYQGKKHFTIHVLIFLSFECYRICVKCVSEAIVGILTKFGPAGHLLTQIKCILLTSASFTDAESHISNDSSWITMGE